MGINQQYVADALCALVGISFRCEGPCVAALDIANTYSAIAIKQNVIANWKPIKGCRGL